MNELERLIAALPRPEPSEKLDQRIDALLAGQPVRLPIARWKSSGAWIATAACIGVLGFFLGRQSVAVSLPHASVIAASPASDPPLEVAPATNVTSIPLNEDQLAGLLAHPAPREGMFGSGHVTIEISTTP